MGGGCAADPALAARERVEGFGAIARWFLREPVWMSFSRTSVREKEAGQVLGLSFLRKEQLT